MVMDNEKKEYIYIADNVKKDFITPNKLGWTTICLFDKGQNIHKQNFNLENEYLPHFIINSFDEIILTHER
jgi:putative hydrolase of the HAD superfamily